MKTDMAGKRFGRLTAIEPISVIRSGRRRTLWRCICDCGSEKISVRESILSGDVSSCGCFQKECARRNRTSHGKSASPEYKSWSGMRDRCGNPQSRAYHNYGGRGVMVCERWEIFELFLVDMGCRPSPLHSLDRIDNEKGYSPDNCRWATKKTQGRNRRGLIATNSTSSLKEASDAAGIIYGTAHSRVHRLGWSPDEAARTPPRSKRKVSE